MSCSLNEVTKWCGVNNAGIREILMIVPSQVTSIPTQYFTPNLSGSVELESGAQAYLIPIARNSASFTERTDITNRAGDFYQQTIQFTIARDRLQVAELIERVRNRRFHIIYTDKNGEQKLVQNMRVAPETQTGAARTDRNGSIFTLTARSEKKAPFLGSEGSIIVDSGMVIIQSPNGTKWLLTVDNCGAVVTIPVTAGVSVESISVPLYLGDDGEIISGP